MAQVKPKKEKLSRLLASSGTASRRKSEELIVNGHVKINRSIVTDVNVHVDPDKDQIYIQGRLINLKEQPKLYFVLHKPVGYICSNRRISPKDKLVVEFFRERTERLFTVGRLDKDTSGLIIVTSDGEFSQKVIHPSFNIHKEYLVKVSQDVTHEHLIKLSEGTEVEGVHVKPIRVTKVRRGTIKIVVSEGKKREVRLLAAAAGLELLELKRIRIGSLVLGTLRSGHWREMTEKERLSLLRII